jgi:hypothetical protein
MFSSPVEKIMSGAEKIEPLVYLSSHINPDLSLSLSLSLSFFLSLSLSHSLCLSLSLHMDYITTIPIV